jgi:hypothetical protein
MSRGFAYIGNTTAQDAEPIHSAVRTAPTKVVTWVGFADMCCHRAQEVRVAVVCGSKIEVVDSRWIRSDTFVIELGRQLDRAAYTRRSVNVSWSLDMSP